MSVARDPGIAAAAAGLDAADALAVAICHAAHAGTARAISSQLSKVGSA